MPMDNGRLTTADKKRPCILGLAVNNGYPQCGHVDGQNEQISHLKDTAGSQKIVMCQSLFDASGFLRKQQFQSMMCMVTGGLERPEVENVGW
ncbi:hypothetical protein MtrunA17_Chr3g0130371 [Medicago truncatula]|uniref:Uncharacterized protein n=1 Tax=Medicago truncatula TaxID=3880 RepID=A0A072V2L2_MEDTR|nr:hypothetical protein MTR_3g096465 [Medicago truncatula]RHN69956.1 hypothetical protein MtrunA17_Chr3g0130371 [Medicago truncatula]